MKAHIRKYEGVRGTVWYGRVDLPPDPKTGKRRQRRFNAPTKKEVERMAAEIITSVEGGGFSEAEAKKITVGQYLTRWIESVEGVRPATRIRYGDILRKHVVPIIGRVLLAKLSPLDVQRLYADRKDEGLSPTTINLLHNILHRALSQAVRWNLLNRNVTELVDAPRPSAPEFTVWSQTQASTFLIAANEDDLASLWRLALLTGMRRGELLGLRWDDLDLVQGKLAVQRTYSRGSGEDGKFSFGTPKTTHSRRSIALARSAIEALHKHRIKQIAAKLKLGSGYQDIGLVFADAIGHPIAPTTLGYKFNLLIKKAGVPRIRIHDLRHTAATLMLANGTHPKIVQEMLGHANISITLDRYSHVTMTMQQQAADQLDELLSDIS